MRETVLVTGVGGPAGRAGATFFIRRGYRVVGADMREVESPASAFRLVPAARDPSFPAALLSVVAEERASLLLCTVTEELPRVSRLQDALQGLGCAACCSPPPAVEVAGDKLRTAEALRAAGLAAPRTLPGSARAEASGLGFPLLSKPRFGRGGRGVLVHETPADLARVGAEEVVFQEFVPGEEFDVNLFVERGGDVPAAVVLHKTGLAGGRVGNATGVERAEGPDVLEIAVRAARALGLSGPLDVDVRRRAGGEPAVLEVNARLGAHALSAPEVLLALEGAWRNGRCA